MTTFAAPPAMAVAGPTEAAEIALTGSPIYRLRSPDPLAVEIIAAAARMVGAHAAAIAAVKHGGPRQPAHVIIGIDADVDVLRQHIAELEAALGFVPRMLGLSMACSPASDPLGAGVLSAGRRVYTAREHGHPASRPMPRGVSSDSVSQELTAQLAAASQRGDASETSYLCHRGIELGLHDFAMSASETMLQLEPSSERTAIARMAALNASCFHEAAEIRGRDYLLDHPVTAPMLMQLCRSVAQQRRRAEAIAISDQIRAIAQQNPSMVPSDILKQAEATKRSLMRAA